jgi:hypothetical protein
MATIDIPANRSIFLVNVSSAAKTFRLPAVSSFPGRMIIFKDIFGAAGNSSIFLSTTGTDIIERSTATTTRLSTTYGAWTYLNDGIRTWFLADMYANTMFISTLSGGSTNLNSFGTLAVWSDATSFSTNNQVLTTWTNKATSTSFSVNCTGTVLTATLNSLPIVRFTTSAQWRISPDVNLSAYTLFWVGRQRGGANGRVLSSTTNNHLYGYWAGYKRSFYVDANPGNHVTAFASDSAWDMFSHSRTAGSAYTFNWNGTSTYSGASSSGNNMTGLAINHWGENSDCDVAEIVLYSVLLNTTQIQYIEGYLAWKWGLQANLPVGHPYRSSAPS